MKLRIKQLLMFICSLVSRWGFYLKLHWSKNKLLVPAEKLGLSYINRYENYTYRIKLVYLNKLEQEKVKESNSNFYSTDIKFILIK